MGNTPLAQRRRDWYARLHVFGCDAHPVRHRGRRRAGGRTAPAPGLRRAAKLAAQRLGQEKPGQTLQATALVHEAYVRLVDVDKAQQWNSRGHFFAAAAEAMRRILVEQARRKQRHKHGGSRQKLPLDPNLVADNSDAEELLAINDALDRLAGQDRQAAELVKLRYFSGLSVEEAAQAPGIPRSTAYVQWSFARAALRTLLEIDPDPTRLDDPDFFWTAGAHSSH